MFSWWAARRNSGVVLISSGLNSRILLYICFQKIKKKIIVYLFIPRPTIVAVWYGIPSGICPSFCTLFPDKSSHSFHRVALKLGGQIDHEVEQCILFRGYSTPDFDRVITFSKIFQTWLCFRITPPTVFYPIGLTHCGHITKTCLYSVDPLKPHFHIVKLGFTGVYIIFLFLLKNIDCGYSLEPPRRGGSNEYPQSMFWADIWKISEFLYLKIFSFRR